MDMVDDQKVMVRRNRRKKDLSAIWKERIDIKSELKALSHLENFMLVTAGAAAVT